MNPAIPLLVLAGLVFGSTGARSAEDGAVTARGNEPGWSVTIRGTEIEIVTDYGNARSTHPKPPPETAGNATRYVIQPEGITIVLEAALCVDTMSGMPFPLRAALEGPKGVLSGCGGEPSSLLTGPEWVVEEIGGSKIVEGSRVTLNFGGDGGVFGKASCNTYRGSWTLSGEGLSIGPVAMTMMACETDALSRQEHAFTSMLEDVARFEIAADGALALVANDGRKTVARREDAR